MTKSTYLGAAAGAALLTLAGTGIASATPYAYGTMSFSNLTLSGLTSGTIDGATVTTSSSASYLSSGDAASAGPNNIGTGPIPLTGGSDTRQSTAGTGPFPGQNSFGQALQTGSGARGDSVITGNLLTGSPAGSASLVAEGRLTDFGSASSTGGTSTGFNFSFTTTAPVTLTLSFTASNDLIATTTAPGDGASAQINASFSVNGNGVSDNFAPSQLNTSVSSSGGTGDGTFSLGPTSFTHSVTLTSAGTYTISLLSGVQERLSAAAVNTPEPASLAILGAGLFGVGLIRRRRQR